MRRGLHLVEILLACLILALLGVAALHTSSMSVTLGREAEGKELALRTARSILQRSAAAGFESLAMLPPIGDVPPFLQSEERPPEREGFTLAAKRMVDHVRPGLVRVIVRVTGKQVATGREVSASMSRLIADPAFRALAAP